MLKRSIRHAGLVTFVLCFTGTVSAQPKPGYMPSSTHIFPAGGQRGTRVAVRVGTECAPPGTDFQLFGHGVSASGVLDIQVNDRGEPAPGRKPTETPITYPRQWQSQIEIATDAPLGAAFWRISCAQGGTCSRPFVVGDLPEFIESESNSSVEKAEAISLPVTVNGQIHGERDVDYFRFTLAAGETVSCEVIAGRLGSNLDPIVEIVDSAGRPVTADQLYIGSDPVIVFKAARDDDYRLRISNVTFRGDPGFVYRINMTPGPFVRAAYPPGGEAGTTIDSELLVINGDGTQSAVSRTIELPETDPGTWTWSDPESGIRSIPLVVDAWPTTTETEPNGATEAAATIPVPRTIYGRFSSADDQDVFAFHAEGGERFTIQCSAFPPGTPALPVITVTDIATGKSSTASSVDDQDGRIVVDWTAPSYGHWLVTARDLRFGSQGGDDFIYRLTVQRAEPEFELLADVDCLNLMQGKETTIDVRARRIGGFDGEIKLSVAGLPKGVTASGTTIAASASSASSAKLKLAANEDVPAGSTAISITGTSAGDSPVSRTAQFRHPGHDAEYISIGQRRHETAHLTVTHKPVFRLYCQEAYLYAHRGSVFPYPMTVERLDGFDGEITLQTGDRQNRDLDGIEMYDVTLASDQSEILLPIYLPETMAINVQSQSQLYSQAWARFTDRHGQKQSVLVLSEKRNMLRSMPSVVKLRATDETLTAAPGATVNCRLRLERTSNFPGPMTVRLRSDNPDEAVTCDEHTIDAGQTEIVVPVRLADVSRAGVQKSLTFRATGLLDDRIQVITEARVQLAVRDAAAAGSE